MPYYRRVFDERRLKPSSIHGLDDLPLLPVLTKRDVVENADELVARNVDASLLVNASTGGSTGTPMLFKRDVRNRDLHYAATAAFSRWYGTRVGERQALIWGAREDLAGLRRLKSRFLSRVLRRPLTLDAYSISNEDLARFLTALRRYRPRVVRGYTHALELLARYANAAGGGPSVPAVVCTAEALSEQQRRLVEGALDTEVFNEYGGREFGPIAAECKYHCGLHVNVFSVHLEVLADGVPVEDGCLGALAGTDLHSYGMPFIRYDLGDVGRWARGMCPCGVQSPRLGAVEGRATGMLIAANGNRLSGVALNVAMGALGIPGQLQFIQAEDTSIEVRVVPEPAFAARHEEAIRDTLRELLGEAIDVEFRRVAEIPRARSGKYIFSESQVGLRRTMAGGSNVQLVRPRARSTMTCIPARLGNVPGRGKTGHATS